jgi:hypothetical protein
MAALPHADSLTGKRVVNGPPACFLYMRFLYICFDID